MLEDSLSTTFAALADPTRRAILARLAEGAARAGDLAQPFPISAPAVSRHLRVLEQAGLIRREVDAQWRLCRLQAPALQAAHGWLDRYRLFWEHSLDRLAALVEQPPRGRAPARPKAVRGGRSRARPGDRPVAATPRKRRPPR